MPNVIRANWYQWWTQKSQAEFMQGAFKTMYVFAQKISIFTTKVLTSANNTAEKELVHASLIKLPFMSSKLKTELRNYQKP